MALKVVVLMGGVSGEREVSLRSGAAAAKALARLGHAVTPFDVTDERLEGVGPDRFDAAFLALHGAFGEDGTVQRLLEGRGLPYTGSGPEASALGMDKWAARQVFSRHGIPVADGVLIRADGAPSVVARQIAPLGWPVVVKPRHGGSSIGVSIVKEAAALPAALEAAAREEGEAVVERFVPGREMTVGILGDRALPPLEVRPRKEFYSYEAKYSAGDTEYLADPTLTPVERARLEEAGLKAFRALGCRGMARVDFRLPADAAPVILEVNTIPGFTEQSLLPKAAAKAGVNFDLLCATLLEDALAASSASVR